MKTISIPLADVTISARCSEGAGPTILLCHGNSCSSRTFFRQIEGSLGRRFRVIAIDLPGHGDSGRAETPEITYTLPGYANILVQVTRQLDIAHAVFVGWSLGGHIVLQAVPQLQDAAGFVIFGTPPLGSNADIPLGLTTEPWLGVAFREDSTEAEIQTLLSNFFKPGATVPVGAREDFDRTDKRARAALAASVGRNELQDERRIAASLKRPIAVIHGEFDAIAMRPYLEAVPMPTLWRGSIQQVDDAGHAPHWEQPEAFNELLAAFAMDCQRPS